MIFIRKARRGGGETRTRVTLRAEIIVRTRTIISFATRRRRRKARRPAARRGANASDSARGNYSSNANHHFIRGPPQRRKARRPAARRGADTSDSARGNYSSNANHHFIREAWPRTCVALRVEVVTWTRTKTFICEARRAAAGRSAPPRGGCAAGRVRHGARCAAAEASAAGGVLSWTHG